MSERDDSMRCTDECYVLSQMCLFSARSYRIMSGVTKKSPVEFQHGEENRCGVAKAGSAYS